LAILPTRFYIPYGGRFLFPQPFPQKAETMKPIALQLYTLRDLCKDDFVPTLEKVAKIGYKAVEFAGFHGMTPGELRTILDELGLSACSAHMPMPNEDNASELIEYCQTLRISRLITGPGGPIKTISEVMACVAKQRKAVELLKGSGIALGLHNHWQEFEPLHDGRLPEDVMIQSIPELFAELDVYWVTVGGQDPADTVARMRKRTPLLHIKDGMVEPRQPMKPIGQGVLDMPSIIAAADPSILEYLIIELDSCDIDPLEAVEESYNYLVGNGLAAGNRPV
jgi:sugar phosphate isomerase/epimerase